MTEPDAREALISDLAERALGAVQPEIDRLRTNLTTVFHQLKAAEREAERLRAELAQAQGKVRAVSQVRCWTNEDGKRFVFADDLLAAIQATPACTCRAEPVHQAGCPAS